MLILCYQQIAFHRALVLAFLATPTAAQETTAGKTEAIGCEIQKIAGHTVKLASVLALPTDLVFHIKKDKPY